MLHLHNRDQMCTPKGQAEMGYVTVEIVKVFLITYVNSIETWFSFK